MTALPPTTDDRPIWDMWLSQNHLPVFTVADEIGTFAAISGEALTTEDLAAKLQVDARALAIHLGLLAALGTLERREGKWRASAMARSWMHPDGEGYYGPMLMGFRQTNPLHGEMLETLRTGARPENAMGSAPEWERGTMSQQVADGIAAFMNSHSIASSMGVARLPEFARAKSLLDVGGGSGIFAIEFARAQPALKAIVLEIDAMCVSAQRYIDKAGVGDRVSTLALNMFENDWPTGHDAHFFSNIFHDWSDETNRLLARKSFAALPSGGTIMLHEMLMDDDGCGPLAAASFSMMMLLRTKGKQYNLPEFRDMLESAGFVGVQAQLTGGSYYSLVTARKP